MKRLLILTIVTASIGFITSGTAAAAPTPSASTYNAGDAANGIADSRHNLGNFGNFTTSLPNIATSGINGTTEICVFCHTPHHSNTGANGDRAPIWNRNNSTAASYTAYGTTLGGSIIDNSNFDYPGSTTLACLSCHDGVTTFDNLANRPGKGIGAMTGATFWNNGSVVSNKMTSGRLNIGTDLSNDHPVSVKYTEPYNALVGVASLRPSNTVISSIDVAAGLADSTASFDGGNLSKNLWAVKGFINASATIGDLLRGFSKNTVECSSCHDPHFNNKSWNEVDSTYGSGNQEFESSGLFLRRVGGNSGSGLCRTCHNK